MCATLKCEISLHSEPCLDLTLIGSFDAVDHVVGHRLAQPRALLLFVGASLPCSLRVRGGMRNRTRQTEQAQGGQSQPAGRVRHAGPTFLPGGLPMVVDHGVLVGYGGVPSGSAIPLGVESSR